MGAEDTGEERQPSHILPRPLTLQKSGPVYAGTGERGFPGGPGAKNPANTGDMEVPSLNADHAAGAGCTAPEPVAGSPGLCSWPVRWAWGCNSWPVAGPGLQLLACVLSLGLQLLACAGASQGCPTPGPGLQLEGTAMRSLEHSNWSSNRCSQHLEQNPQH